MQVLFGVLLIISSNILNSLNKIWFGSNENLYNPLQYAFVAYGFALLIFNLIKYINKNKRIRIHEHWMIWVWLNIISCMTFLCFLYALKLMSPVLVSCIETGFLVILVSAVDKKKRDSIDMLQALAMLGILVTTFLSGYFDNKNLFRSINTLGIMLALLTSLGVAIIILLQKKLLSKGYKPYEIMAHRFYMIVIVSFGGLLLNNEFIITFKMISFDFIIMTLLSVSVCLFLLQKGLEFITPTLSGAIMATMPVTTFFVSVSFGNEFTVNLFLSTVALMFCISVFIYLNTKSTRFISVASRSLNTESVAVSHSFNNNCLNIKEIKSEDLSVIANKPNSF